MIKKSISFAIALTLEALALWCLAKAGAGDMPLLLQAAALHFGGLLLGGFTVWQLSPDSLRHRKGSFAALIIGFGLPLPCVGLVFLVLFALLLHQQPSTDPEKHYFFGERQALSPPKFSPLNSGAPRSVLDIMNAKENEPRRRAVLALRNLDPKQSIPVLVKAIQDSDEQVRLLAQAQFDKLTEDLEYGVKKAEIELSKGGVSAAKRIQLAEQYHEMVYLGLGSSETEALYLVRAIALLQQALELEPNHPQARFMLLKCCIKNRQVKAARECLDSLKKDGYQPEFLAAWESDVCFQDHDWDGLNRILERMQNRWRTDARMGEIVDLWLGPPVSDT
jgi:pentatricopeptide repeat protein